MRIKLAADEQREQQWAAGQATELAAAYAVHVARMGKAAGKASSERDAITALLAR